MFRYETAPKFKKPVFKKHQPDDSNKFQPLPKPTGQYPYHLNLDSVRPMPDQNRMAFHMMGDTGSIRHVDFLKLVVTELVEQFTDKDELQFLYHLGDIVYNHGEAHEYERQFFKPFEKYPAPIFAIPGNHDSDVNPDSRKPYKSLDAFVRVFCDTEPRTVPFSGGAERKSMVQPNIFWTLVTPLANIIGLYSNVTKFGVVTDEERNWLIEELRRAQLERPDKAIIVCQHHAPYSADINHGASIPMITFLEGVFEETGIRPDAVFSGHVHNYQRFTKHYEDGKTLSYVVAGGGGYDELHPVATTDDRRFDPNNALFDNVDLEYYCDNKHGFLKIILEKTDGKLTLTGEFYTIPHEKKPDPGMTAVLADRFVIEI
jgi:hypothetical protein